MNTFTELVQNGFEVARIETREDGKPLVRISNPEPFYFVRTWEGMSSEDVYSHIEHAEQDALGYSVEASVEVQPDGEGMIDIDIATQKMHDEFLADYHASQKDILPDDEPVTVAPSDSGEQVVAAPGDASWLSRLLRILMFWKKEADSPIVKREPS